MIWKGSFDEACDVCVDPFYSESNLRYLEKIACEVAEGKAHFEQHDLIEVDL